ncbi:MAG: zinc ribbon domain-containing protein [Ignavibacteria bacterium]|nr:zinc ribbon domain-containing protein [Ignavibacteria bacterium]
MELFDKLSKAAKSVASKGADTLEVTRINGKIANEKAAIETIKMQIGDYYWRLYEDGEDLDEEVRELCLEIQDIEEIILELEHEIEIINKRNLKEVDDSEADEAMMIPGFILCPQCQTINKADASFCKECGFRFEKTHMEAEYREVFVDCSNCGAENPVGSKFCTVCGTKLS